MARGQSRRTRDERRRTKRPIVLIVCEGETERRYFLDIKERFRANGIIVKPSDKSDSLGILAFPKAEERRLGRNGKLVSETWLVFDAENSPAREERHYAEAMVKACSAKKRMANSSPCFEYWPQLHYLPNARALTTKETVKKLSGDGAVPGYKKPILPYDDLWERYASGSPSAAARSVRAAADRAGDDPRLATPVTYVDELVDRLYEDFG